MSQPIKAADLFSDETSAVGAAQRLENYLGELNKSFASPQGADGTVNAAAQLEQMVANKSLTPDALSALNTALASQRAAQADLVKDITSTSPFGQTNGGFAAFDLEAPAKMLTPRPTPLRNKIARKKGVGYSHRLKRITGFTGTGTGGLGQVWPGVTESTTTAFGSINFQRGPKISYAADDVIVPYFSYSLSDAVSFDANFSGQGYQDLRQLSSTSTLYATMLMEERMMLMSRGTASGLSGALAAPTITLSQSAAATGETGLANTTYYVRVTADAGAFGESVSSAEGSITITGTQVLNIAVTAPALTVGNLGYNVYIGTTTGAANTKYQGRITSLNGRVLGSGVGLGDNLIYSTTSTRVPSTSTDTSAYATGYDGMLPQIFAGGVVNRINSTFSTSNPGAEFQTVFGTMWDNVKGDPDEIFLNGSDRKQLSDAIKSGSNANYRLNLSQDEVGNYVGGAVIGALNNEITGKLVNLTVHPWLPQGVAPVISYTLPIPDTQVTDVWASVNVQDYMGVQWPTTQFAYEFSTYFRGTFVGYAPAWNGVVTGIKSA
jgi:hypothetical protein